MSDILAFPSPVALNDVFLSEADDIMARMVSASSPPSYQSTLCTLVSCIRLDHLSMFFY